MINKQGGKLLLVFYLTYRSACDQAYKPADIAIKEIVGF